MDAEIVKTEPETEENVIRVIMIGQRRTGKSSMLSSMIDQMNALGTQTGFSFKADAATELLMTKKKSQLKNIFDCHEQYDLFDTFSGTYNGTNISAATDVSDRYRFTLQLTNSDSSQKPYIVEFMDIRGEDMQEDDARISQEIAKSAVILVAVDTPALMEYAEDDTGIGRFHYRVNKPELVYSRIVESDAIAEEMSEAEQERLKQEAKNIDIPHVPRFIQSAVEKIKVEWSKSQSTAQLRVPKLILMVPIKCEKYYHTDDQIIRLHEQYGCVDKAKVLDVRKMRIILEKGYQNLFDFIREHDGYSLAITPILTMGDVVFDHYQTEEDSVIVFDDDAPDSLRGIPMQQIFRFRKDAQNIKFSPKYCEQPLLYLLSYISAFSEMTQKSLADNIVRKYGSTVVFVLSVLTFGLLGVLLAYLAEMGYHALSNILQDKSMLEAIASVKKNLKISGDGYEVVYDRLNLKGGTSV